jgi:hypothetical protein
MRGLTKEQAQVLAFIQARMQRMRRPPWRCCSNSRSSLRGCLHGWRGPGRSLMGVSNSKPAWIRPEGAAAVAHGGVEPPEGSCCGRQAYERRNGCWGP